MIEMPCRACIAEDYAKIRHALSVSSRILPEPLGLDLRSPHRELYEQICRGRAPNPTPALTFSPLPAQQRRAAPHGAASPHETRS